MSVAAVGFAVLCASYVAASFGLSRTAWHLVGSALVVAGYGTLAVASAARADGREQAELVGHAALAAFFALSYVLPVTGAVRPYDALALAGHGLFLTSRALDSRRCELLSDACLTAYYAVGTLHATHLGGTVGRAQAVGRALLSACYAGALLNPLARP